LAIAFIVASGSASSTSSGDIIKTFPAGGKAAGKVTVLKIQTATHI
jgi:hypothetical protein